jgi:hypothetical protein
VAIIARRHRNPIGTCLSYHVAARVTPDRARATRVGDRGQLAKKERWLGSV